MAQKRPIPQRELAICQRLRKWRFSLNWSRASFARQLGLRAARLQNYELLRAPLPYWVGARICETFHVSQQWLADGWTRGSGYDALLAPEVKAGISPRLPFGAAYDRFLKPTLSAEPGSALKQRLEAKQPELKADHVEAKLHSMIGASAGDRAALASLFKAVMDTLPAHLVWPYYWRLLAASDQFQAEHAPDSQKKNLTPPSTSGSVSLVKSLLKNLLADANRLTSESGKKTELADFLCAPLASVSRWLAGKRKPGSEITLRLSAWVKTEEGNQTKSPAPALTGTRHKTRMKDLNENTKSRKSSPP